VPRLRRLCRAAKNQLTVMTNAEVVCVDGVHGVEAVVVRYTRTGRLCAVNTSAFLSYDGSTHPPRARIGDMPLEIRKIEPQHGEMLESVPCKGQSAQPVRVRLKEVSVRLDSYPGDGRVTEPSKPRGQRPAFGAGQRAYGPQHA
jgi:hypothetical protein